MLKPRNFHVMPNTSYGRLHKSESSSVSTNLCLTIQPEENIRTKTVACGPAIVQGYAELAYTTLYITCA